jgi:hypothetical protein
MMQSFFTLTFVKLTICTVQVDLKPESELISCSSCDGPHYGSLIQRRFKQFWLLFLSDERYVLHKSILRPLVHYCLYHFKTVSTSLAGEGDAK